MRSLNLISFALLFILTCPSILAQDTLPQFTALTKGNNRVIISWTNNYKYVSQISIQRSSDSLKNFSTILTVPDPNVPQNGFVDAKGPNNHLYYRLFIVLDSGKYVFSRSKKATWDTARKEILPDPATLNGSKQVVVAKDLTNTESREITKKTIPTTASTSPATLPEPEKFFILVRKDSIIGKVSQNQYKRFRDSVVTRTKDTMVFKSVDTIQIKVFVPREVYRPSKYIFTEKDGNVAIVLPDAPIKKYHIKFYEDDLSPLFEVKQVKEPYLLLDKVNFQHSGWFRFELFEGTTLVEKHRFLIPREF